MEFVEKKPNVRLADRIKAYIPSDNSFRLDRSNTQILNCSVKLQLAKLRKIFDWRRNACRFEKTRS